jgi:serine/threonine protein kinase
VHAFGRYRLVELIASGGMAEVWRATLDGPAGVRKEVALKLLRGEHAARSDFARMLVEEARLAARLAHANVVQVLELCEEGGRFAIAMELVRGRDLGRVVERCRELGLRIGLPRVLHLGVEVAKALAYAHRLAEDGQPVGLVHRDVSPSNVLVSCEGAA